MEGRSEGHIWAGSFGGGRPGRLRVQEEIARKVRSELASGLRAVPPMASGAIPTKGAAFDAVLRGRYLLQRRDSKSLEGAIRAFQDAIRLDTAYATGFAGLSSANS